MGATKCPSCNHFQYFNPCGSVVAVCESCCFVFRGDHNRLADQVAPYGLLVTDQELKRCSIGPVEKFRVIRVWTNETDRISVSVTPTPRGFLVQLTDTDAGEIFDVMRIFPHEDDAITYAKKCVEVSVAGRGG